MRPFAHFLIALLRRSDPRRSRPTSSHESDRHPRRSPLRLCRPSFATSEQQSTVAETTTTYQILACPSAPVLHILLLLLGVFRVHFRHVAFCEILERGASCRLRCQQDIFPSYSDRPRARMLFLVLHPNGKRIARREALPATLTLTMSSSKSSGGTLFQT